MFIRCNFCHKLVLKWFYTSHKARHTKRRPDGQMTEHITRAPTDRFTGSLDDEPQSYRHERCGVVTGMPEEIIRSYLVDPLMYSDQSFCCGCGDYIDSAYLFWIETGESVQDYMGRLRRQYLRDEFGMQIGKRPKGVFITKQAKAAIQDALRQHGLDSSYFTLSVQCENEHVQYAAGVQPDYDRRAERLLEASGLEIIVQRDQVELLDGTVVHYRNTGEKGFGITRLYAHFNRSGE